MRGKKAKNREQEVDRKYKSPLIGRLINKVMQHGKKNRAEEIVYYALEEGASKSKVDVVDFMNQAIDNVRPALELRARRVGGSNYQIPIPVTPERQETLAIRWIVDLARNKSGQPFKELLLTELISAYKGEGEAVKKKNDVERMAEANKAFAHFRW
ncbi:MAG: 30S ribosomal protein S7 [candidate division WS6 bacterium 34_10]|uniref:Small ribosomal subunit protein uS7 n=1 Tax=candidate division WS6 bacterium 34_10 TaxID=1641389 RepID=A0A101HIU1_9BACT|nr:MAG: 30S ribosomal protein S7 [candidate division WS6 bacterium 34_10]